MLHEVTFTPAAYTRKPHHTFTSPADFSTARRGLGQLLLSTGAVLALGLGWLRVRPVIPL